jgi:intraflagellar transport protein 122
MINDQKVRIKCKELVKKISIYKDRLAVQLNDKILIYLASSDETKEMKYKLFKKINKSVECSLLVVTSHDIILCQEKKLQMMNFVGEIEREWILESLIRYIKVLGGPSKKESLLVGLKNGNVLKIFIDNSFPIVLIKQNVPIRCVDVSLGKTKLAVVDDNNNLSVYDLVTKDLLYSEMNVTSVAWNTDLDDILAYSGNGMLFIKTGNIPPTTQKMNGFVVGFKVIFTY